MTNKKKTENYGKNNTTKKIVSNEGKSEEKLRKTMTNEEKQ